MYSTFEHREQNSQNAKLYSKSWETAKYYWNICTWESFWNCQNVNSIAIVVVIVLICYRYIPYFRSLTIIYLSCTTSLTFSKFQYVFSDGNIIKQIIVTIIRYIINLIYLHTTIYVSIIYILHYIQFNINHCRVYTRFWILFYHILNLN